VGTREVGRLFRGLPRGARADQHTPRTLVCGTRGSETGAQRAGGAGDGRGVGGAGPQVSTSAARHRGLQESARALLELAVWTYDDKGDVAAYDEERSLVA